MPRKIILITIDSLRHDFLRQLGIESFLGGATVFENCYAAAVPTCLAMPAIFQSIYPSRSMKTITLEPGIPTFVEKLRENGFATAGLVDANPFCSALLGYSRGFNYFEDFLFPQENAGLLKRVIPAEIRAASRLIAGTFDVQRILLHTNLMLRMALQFLQSNKHSKLFLWVHFAEAHFPYRLPSGIGRRIRAVLTVRRAMATLSKPNLRQKETLLLREMYTESIAHLGKKLNQLFSLLPGSIGDYDIFITSDHGEQFGERGGFFHRMNVYEEVAHVPLAVKLAEKKLAARITGLRSTIDIAATILEIAGVKKPSGFTGNGLFSRPRSYVITETTRQPATAFGSTITEIKARPLRQIGFMCSARSGNYSVVQAGSEMLAYDRIADRKELHTLSADNAEIRGLMRAVKRHIRKIFKPQAE